MSNKLVIAGAGSGKTRLLIQEALKIKAEKILITTFTQANEIEIRRKIIKVNRCIPENITVQTWFSFLLQHGARPYQGCLINDEITGLVLVNESSAPYSKEADTKKHYFTNKKIYSDKLAKFVVKINSKTNGAVITRLSRIFSHIFIDEVQDLAGWDLDFLKLLFACKSNILLVGDPRQGTYSTNNSTKNKKFQKAEIVHFFQDKSIAIETDETSLVTNYRSEKDICNLANKLFPDFKKMIPRSSNDGHHSGVFLIKEKNVESYLKKYNPMQLRYNSKTTVNENYSVMTFGSSKGLEFERILIYPTKAILEWLEDNEVEFASTTRSKFYVALTRGMQSVGIICNIDSVEGLQKYEE